MEKITVPFITGDGVGAEITPSMQAVVNAALKKAYGDSRSIEWKEVLAGPCWPHGIRPMRPRRSPR